MFIKINLFREIRKYIVLAEQSFQIAITYRIRFLTTLATSLVQVIVLYYIWKVVYQGQISIKGFTLSQMITYVFISYGVKNLYTFYIEADISKGIRNGNITIDLIRPLNYQLARFFESLGSVIFEGCLVIIIVIILGMSLFKIELPSNTNTILFCISLTLSIFINFTISYIVGLFSFWTTSVFGFVNAKRFISDFFSGGLIPISFFPGWLQTIAFILPFNTIVHLPVSIYLGQLTGRKALFALMIQSIWGIGLWITGDILWHQASKKLTIHGG